MHNECGYKDVSDFHMKMEGSNRLREGEDPIMVEIPMRQEKIQLYEQTRDPCSHLSRRYIFWHHADTFRHLPQWECK